MRSGKPGKSISGVEVTNISRKGFWIFIGEKEYLVPFEEFPWFREARIGELLNVELPSPHHLYWPDLDIDLAVESIEHPERFPLLSRRQTASQARAATKIRRGTAARRKRTTGRG